MEFSLSFTQIDFSRPVHWIDTNPTTSKQSPTMDHIYCKFNLPWTYPLNQDDTKKLVLLTSFFSHQA